MVYAENKKTRSIASISPSFAKSMLLSFNLSCRSSGCFYLEMRTNAGVASLVNS